MKLNKTHIKILLQLSQRDYRSVVALSKDLQMIPSTVDMALKTLLDMGFMEMARIGKSVRVSLSSNKHARAYKKLVTLYSHMGFEDILSGHNIQIMLTLLRNRRSKKSLSEKLYVSTRTVERSIQSLQSYGLVRNEDGSYILNDQHTKLYEFVREFQAYVNMKIARSCDSRATIIWENLDEFIMETPNPVNQNGFYATGYGTLAQYGIPLLTANRYHYFHSPYKSDLRLEDVCLHILTINPSSIRANLYVSLAIIKNRSIWDWKYLEQESRTYQLDDMARKLRMFIENQGNVRSKGFPSWAELKEKAEGYDIHV